MQTRIFSSNAEVPVTIANLLLRAIESNLPDFTKAAEMTVHSVVHVKTIQSNQYWKSCTEILLTFGEDKDLRRPQEASGSGVIISARWLYSYK